METKTYNGWTNYETWAVALWLDNDEGSYDHWRERAQEAYNDAEKGGNYDSETRDENATATLREELKDWHDERQTELQGVDGTVFADLLNAALSEVHYHEIAEHYVADVDKTEEEPSEAEA
jgi:hypothetical protein